VRGWWWGGRRQQPSLRCKSITLGGAGQEAADAEEKRRKEEEERARRAREKEKAAREREEAKRRLSNYKCSKEAEEERKRREDEQRDALERERAKVGLSPSLPPSLPSLSSLPQPLDPSPNCVTRRAGTVQDIGGGDGCAAGAQNRSAALRLLGPSSQRGTLFHPRASTPTLARGRTLTRSCFSGELCPCMCRILRGCVVARGPVTPEIAPTQIGSVSVCTLASMSVCTLASAYVRMVL